MHDLSDLVQGYSRFVAGRGKEETQLYQDLAEFGQSPKTMVISCCDSRVDPAKIFDAGPGELFVVRNVANLVPPFEPDGSYHGTSAALEFAVTGLKVENIVVMGHALCGGVKAFIDSRLDATDDEGFIAKWISMLEPAGAKVLDCGHRHSTEEQQQAMELAGIRNSLENLRTFPFVQEALDNGQLTLRGAYFSIFNGTLLGMDPATGEFEPVAG